MPNKDDEDYIPLGPAIEECIDTFERIEGEYTSNVENRLEPFFRSHERYLSAANKGNYIQRLARLEGDDLTAYYGGKMIETAAEVKECLRDLEKLLGAPAQNIDKIYDTALKMPVEKRTFTNLRQMIEYTGYPRKSR